MRMAPADQGFSPANLQGAQIDLGLIMDFEPTVAQHLFEIATHGRCALLSRRFRRRFDGTGCGGRARDHTVEPSLEFCNAKWLAERRKHVEPVRTANLLDLGERTFV